MKTEKKKPLTFEENKIALTFPVCGEAQLRNPVQCKPVTKDSSNPFDTPDINYIVSCGNCETGNLRLVVGKRDNALHIGYEVGQLAI